MWNGSARVIPTQIRRETDRQQSALGESPNFQKGSRDGPVPCPSTLVDRQIFQAGGFWKTAIYQAKASCTFHPLAPDPSARVATIVLDAKSVALEDRSNRACWPRRNETLKRVSLVFCRHGVIQNDPNLISFPVRISGLKGKTLTGRLIN